ncbi:MAG: Ig-like domain-containing protein [Anaerolineales bacterium]|nr:Ig-like domain-containing protein [Anaerolineales bacterium]
MHRPIPFFRPSAKARLTGCLLLGLLFLASLTPAFAQSSSIQATVDSSNTAAFPEIELAVSVYDEQGYPLRDLTQENFTLTEDGASVVSLSAEATYERPIQIVFLIDRSASMGYGIRPTPLENAIAVCRSLIGNLAPEDQAALIAFSESVDWLQDLTPDKSILQTRLDSLRTKGQSTLLNDAFLAAVERLEKSGATRPVIILLTDGVDSGKSRLDWDETIDAVVQASTVVYTISWGGAKAEDMKKLTGLTRGRSHILAAPPGQYPDAKAFQVAINDISDDLKNSRLQYHLAYHSALPMDGKEHTLNLTINSLGRQAQATTMVIAPRSEVQILLSDPTDGASVGGIVPLAPKFSGPEDIVQMQVLLNGDLLETLNHPPFEYRWDTTTLPPDSYTLSLIAEDRSGATARKDVTVNVRPAVLVTISSPALGATLSMPTLFAAQVDALASTAKVEFILDGKTTLKTLTTEPYEFSWDPRNASDGPHEITVRAWDVNGMNGEASLKFLVSTTGDGGGLGGAALVAAAAAGVAVLALVFALRSRQRRSVKAGSAQLTSIPSTGGQSIHVGSGKAGAGASLLESKGLNPGHVWELPPGGEVRLGRKRDENDIPLIGISASRRHALIRYQDGAYVIYSLKPENPTLVNGVGVQQKALQAGDVIQLGDSIFQFQG